VHDRLGHVNPTRCVRLSLGNQRSAAVPGTDPQPSRGANIAYLPHHQQFVLVENVDVVVDSVLGHKTR
jgi:hypothetical protein